MGLLDRFFGPPSRDKFAQLVLQGLRRISLSGKIEYDKAEYRLLGKGDCPEVLNLGNLYLEFAAVPRAERGKIVQKAVRSWHVHNKETPEEFEDAQHDLLPAVRSRGYFELARLRTKIEFSRAFCPPYKLLGDHLAVGLVYDMHEAMRSVTAEDLEGWGKTFYEALEIAQENLRKLPQSFIGPQDGPGLYLATNNDSYDCCRLLLPEVLRQFRLKGDPVAMVPTRNTLLVAGSDDEEALQAMGKLAEGAFINQPWPLSTAAVRLTADDEWVSWLPPVESPLHKDFKLMLVGALANDYEEQGALLRKLHEKEGTDVFVASFSAMQNQQTGRVFSYAVWPGEVEALLSEVERVAVMAKPDSEPQMHFWAVVREVVGDLLEPTDLYPPRYRVAGYPTEEQLAAMGEPMPL